jgi:hypothetical protein
MLRSKVCWYAFPIMLDHMSRVIKTRHQKTGLKNIAVQYVKCKAAKVAAGPAPNGDERRAYQAAQGGGSATGCGLRIKQIV